MNKEEILEVHHALHDPNKTSVHLKIHLMTINQFFFSNILVHF